MEVKVVSETSIVKKQRCLLMRNDIEIWLDDEKANQIGESLAQQPKGLLKIEDRFVNAVDIIGIFNPKDMQIMQERRRGRWQCKYNTWHRKDDICECGRAH